MTAADRRFGRRRFLLGAASGAAATAAVGVFYISARNDGSADGESRLEEFISAGNFSPDVGERYLVSQSMREWSVDDLLLQVETSIGDDEDIRTAIRMRIAADFLDGEICRLDGWFLAVTECRLAAIAFLLGGQDHYVEEPSLLPRGPLDHLPNMVFGQLERWGPRWGEVGKPFNLQPDGNSALWFHFSDLGRYPDYKIYLGSEAARTKMAAQGGLVTAGVTSSQVEKLTSVEGEIPIHLVDPVRGKQLVGYLDIRASE